MSFIAGTASAIASDARGVTERSSRDALQHWLVVVSFAVDLALLVGSLSIAYWMRFESSLRYYGVIDDQIVFRDYLGHIAFGAMTLVLIFARFRLYEGKNLLSYRETMRIVAKAMCLWVVAYLAVSLVLKFNPPISRIYCLLGFANAVVFILGWRRLLFRILRHERFAGALRQRVVFIGWTSECESAAKRFGEGRGHPIDVAGVILPPNGSFETPLPPRVPVLGGFSACRRVLKHGAVDTVLVADLDLNRSELADLASLCEKEMIEFKLVPTCFRILLSGLHLESISGMPVLGISKLPLHSTFNIYLKRCLDLAGGLALMILSAPIVAVFGALVYLESPGPIFYRQRRLGRNGHLFDMIKLRSMRMDAERDGKPGWTVKGDPRVLKIGRFMRAWNIDEVPQFWNVVKGEMSLVGPRPERPELIETFKEEIPHYNARHGIKPGITGWAQVNGLRGDTDLGERIRLDLDYIENWSILFDCQIMLMTFLTRENAC